MRLRHFAPLALLIVAACSPGKTTPPPPPAPVEAPPVAEANPLEGSFGILCQWDDTKELAGMRITVEGAQAPKVTMTFCEGVCAKYAISNAKRNEDQIEFDGVPNVEGQPNVPLHFVGRFNDGGLIIEGRGKTASMDPQILKRTETAYCRTGSSRAKVP